MTINGTEDQRRATTPARRRWLVVVLLPVVLMACVALAWRGLSTAAGTEVEPFVAAEAGAIEGNVAAGGQSLQSEGPATITGQPKSDTTTSLPQSGDMLLAPAVVWPVADFIVSEQGVLRVDGSVNRVGRDLSFTASPGRTQVMKTGGMAASFGFDPSLVAITANTDGLVAFTAPFSPGHDIYLPGPRTSSEIVVVDTAESVPRSYSFAANIVPEVFTADGLGLFVIDHVPADQPVGYRVKLLDLASGDLADVFGPWKRPPSEYMEGVGRRQIGSPNGDMFFTLYTRQPADHGQATAPEPHDHNQDSLASGTSAPNTQHGFVHTLSLTDEWAICIDLPALFGQGAPETGALVLDGDGSQLFVVDANAGGDDSERGRVAVYDTTDMATERVLEQMPQPVLDAPVELTDDAAVSAIIVGDPDHQASSTDDRRSLLVAQGRHVQYLRVAERFQVTRRHTFASDVEDLVVDSDGRAFAVVGGRLVPLPSHQKSG